MRFIPRNFLKVSEYEVRYRSWGPAAGQWQQEELVTIEQVSSSMLRAYSLQESNEVDAGGVEEMAPQNTPFSYAKYFEVRALREQ